jgi:hypothetical protein
VANDRTDLALRHLDYMGSKVEGHGDQGWVALESPPHARGQATCECGFRTSVVTAGDAVREMATHRRQAVLDGADVISADGKRVGRNPLP